MTAQRQCAPYREKMTAQLERLPLAENQSAAGGSIRTFSTDKAGKIALCCIAGSGGRQLGLCTIFPQVDFDLPVFFSSWQESPGEISFVVDLLPTVDTLVDEAYRVRYIDPLMTLWERFAALPGICPEEDDELRSACSINYTAAAVPVENEGLRLAALAAPTAYLKQYCGFLSTAERVQDGARRAEQLRKSAAIRDILGGYITRLLAGPACRDLDREAAGLLPAVLL